MTGGAYLLCSAQGLPFASCALGCGGLESTPGNFLSDGDPKFLRLCCQKVAVDAGAWSQKSPFATRISSFPVFVVPMLADEHVLYSCFIAFDDEKRWADCDSTSYSHYFIASLAAHWLLAHCSDGLAPFLADVEACVNNRTANSTFIDSVDSDDWIDELVTQHSFASSLRDFQNVALPAILSSTAQPLAQRIPQSLVDCFRVPMVSKAALAVYQAALFPEQEETSALEVLFSCCLRQAPPHTSFAALASSTSSSLRSLTRQAQREQGAQVSICRVDHLHVLIIATPLERASAVMMLTLAVTDPASLLASDPTSSNQLVERVSRSRMSSTLLEMVEMASRWSSSLFSVSTE